MALKTFTKSVYLGTTSGTYGSSASLVLTVIENSTNIETNKSNVTATLQFIIDRYNWRASSASWSISGYKSASGSLVGMQYYSGTTTLWSETFDVPHDSAGNATISFDFSFSSTNTYGGSGSLSCELTNIPRQANLTSAPDFNDESNPTIYYSNPAGNSVSSLEACISLTGARDDISYRAVGKTDTSYTFYLTESERNVLRSSCPNSKTLSVIFYLRTVIGGNTYYSTIQKTMNIVNGNPIVSLTAEDTNKTLATGNTIQDLTGDTTNKTIIKYLSDVLLSLTASARKYASIRSTQISAGTGEYVNNSGNFNHTFTNVSTNSFTGKAVDSREPNGFEGYAYISSSNLTMLDYTPLSISPVRLYRTNQTGNDLYAEIDGNYFKGNFNNTPNVLTLSFKYKESGTSWTGTETWQTLTPTISQSDNTYSFDGLLGSNFDYTKIYDFVFKAEDLALERTYETSSTPGIPIIGIFEDLIEAWGEVFIYK